MMIKSEDFRAVMSAYGTGVTVATAALPDGTRVGLTVNSFTSVSLDPPLVLFCLDKRAASLSVFNQAEGFAINILHAEQEAVSRAFAQRGQGPERWQGVALETWQSGAPVLTQALASIDCARHALHDAGDHVIVVGRVLQLRRGQGQPLLYWNSQYQRLVAAG